MTSLALDVPRLLDHCYISFWIPTAVLTTALLVKLPTIIRLWRDPLLRAVGGLLVLACAVFVFCTPSTIAAVNRLTGVPNIAAPWCYSLVTAMSASCLLLILTWRSGLSDGSAATRRAMRRVVMAYAAVIVALWVLFLLADAPVERVRDLDTYYATTPFMREEILLYVVAHNVACVISSRLVWNWVRTEGLDAWLRWGLKLLGAGFVLNLIFDASKLTAVLARWCGRDLDWLSTDLAPPVAALCAILVAVGFMLPHLGQYLQERWRLRLAHRELRPLYRLMRTVNGDGVPFVLRSTPELRLTRRETFIRDALLQLTRHIDTDLGSRSYDTALGLGHPPQRARALAAAVTVVDAVGHRARVPEPPEPTAGPDTTSLLQEIGAISRALRSPHDIETIRARTTAGAAPLATEHVAVPD
ncbi:MAB_1171c family putative transporter [Streptomyces sp. NK08204]|uniref:MAB_1171c family putative transporter n=1 Tax=Streptomyces sp. NK08204 TaxID=2873260 RepID=UPI001CECEF16|nr:MAB_1171c family putative transporter [Streptomyces sp. NK08204]